MKIIYEAVELILRCLEIVHGILHPVEASENVKLRPLLASPTFHFKVKREKVLKFQPPL